MIRELYSSVKSDSQSARALSIIIVGVFFIVIVLTFYLLRLGSLDVFLYRPGADVSDLTITFWPNITYIQQSIKTFGEFPLWRSLIFAGMPFDADPQSGLWYLPNLIFLLLPATVGFNLLFIFHTALAGLGMWTWSRQTGTSSVGALFAGLAYAFAPKAFAHLGTGHVGLFYAATYVPWVMWAAYRIGSGNWGYAGMLGLAFGLQIFAHPQLAFYTGMVAGIYAIGIALTKNKTHSLLKRSNPVFKGLLIGFGLALTISAVQLIPMLKLAPLTARSGMDFNATAVSSLPLNALWGLVLPNYRGFMDYMLYAGISVLGLALFAFKRRQAWFWGSFIVLALIYSLGTNTPVYGFVYDLLPILSWLRAPSRIWFVASAALALLSGWGMDQLMKGISNILTRHWLNLFLAVFSTISGCLSIGYLFLFGKPPAYLIDFSVFVLITCGLIFGIVNQHIKRSHFASFIIVLSMIDLWVMDSSLIEGHSAETVFQENGVGAYLARQKHEQQPFRVYSPSYSLPRQIATRYGLETVDGVDPLYLESYDRFMQMASGVERLNYGVTVPAMEGSDIATTNHDAVPSPVLLGLLNVRYVATEFPIDIDGLHEITKFSETILYENENFLPRAFIVGKIDPTDNFNSAMKWLANHDPGKEAVVSNGISLQSGDVQYQIKWLNQSSNNLVLEVDLDRQGIMVISQVHYPGWKASIDNQPVKLWNVDGILDGIYLEPGKHNVKITYRPNLLYVGLILSIIGGTISILMLAKAKHPDQESL